MVISPMVALWLSQVEEDVNLAQILAEFGTLPEIVTTIADPYEKGEIPPPPRNIDRLKVPTDVYATPAGRMMVLVHQVI